jgi:hypothetical protein
MRRYGGVKGIRGIKQNLVFVEEEVAAVVLEKIHADQADLVWAVLRRTHQGEVAPRDRANFEMRHSNEIIGAAGKHSGRALCLARSEGGGVGVKWRPAPCRASIEEKPVGMAIDGSIDQDLGRCGIIFVWLNDQIECGHSASQGMLTAPNITQSPLQQ